MMGKLHKSDRKSDQNNDEDHQWQMTANEYEMAVRVLCVSAT